MNVLNKLTKKNLLLNKKRTVVTIIGNAFYCAGLCGCRIGHECTADVCKSY